MHEHKQLLEALSAWLLVLSVPLSGPCKGVLRELKAGLAFKCSRERQIQTHGYAHIQIQARTS